MMKKALLCLAFAAMAGTAFAQVGSPRNMKFLGVSAGMETNTISFVPKIKQTLHPEPMFGVSFRHTTEKYFFLICGTQTELNYSVRGWTELIEDGSGNEYSRVTHYIDLPFMAHLGVGREIRGLQGYLNAGPQISYLISEKEIYGGTEPWDISNRPNYVVEQYGKDTENKFDYGITAGIGAELHTGMGTFGVEGRYYFGLGNIFGISKTDYFARCANGTISVRATYMVRF